MLSWIPNLRRMRANSYKVVLRLVIVSPVGTNKFDLYNCSHYLDKDGVQMENIVNKSEKEELIQTLTGALPVLRAAIGISQGEIAEYIGVSRQTYCAFEIGKRQMSWNTFLSLFLFFISNAETNNLLKTKKGFITQVYKVLQYKSEQNSVQYP